MRLTIHENFILDIEVKDSGDKKTLEFYQTFPNAQNPRKHRVLQLTLAPAALRAIAHFIKEQA